MPGYELMRQQDEHRIAPGGDVILTLLQDGPNLILLQDPKTVTEQIRTLVQSFGVSTVTLVGDRWAEVTLQERRLTLEIDPEARVSEARLDGCYVIKTDVPARAATADTNHQRYKDLARVERACRTFKSGHLEIRPTFVQTEASTRGHVFVVMLAYLLERELDHYWRSLDLPVSEALDELGSLRGVGITIGNTTCQQVPQPTGLCQELLTRAEIALPEILPRRKVHVATRKKSSKD